MADLLSTIAILSHRRDADSTTLTVMRVVLILDTGRHPSSQVAIQADHPPTIAQLRSVLPADLVTAGKPLYSATRLLPDDARLGEPDLRSGSRLSSVRRAQPLATALTLRVVAGPDCGWSVPLHRGRFTIGRAEDTDIVVADPGLSRRHLELTVGAFSVEVCDLGSTNGSTVADRRLSTERSRLPVAAVLSAANTVMELYEGAEPPALAVAGRDGKLAVRPVAAAEPTPPEAPRSPDSAPLPRRPGIPWLVALLPMSASLGVALALRSLPLVAFAAVSPLTVFAGAAAERLEWRRGVREATGQQVELVRAAREAAERALAEEVAQLRHCHPDPARLLATAQRVGHRLWERPMGAPLFLKVRVGLADQPSAVMARTAGELTPTTLRQVPAAIDLALAPTVISGPRHASIALVRWLVGQVLVLHSPIHVSIWLLTDPVNGDEWRWLRWLAGHHCVVAVTAAGRARAATAIRALYEEREQAVRCGQSWSGRWNLLVVDPANLITELPALDAVLDLGLSVGIAVVYVALRDRAPAGSSNRVRFLEDAAVQAIIETPGRAPLITVPDRVRADWSEHLGRALAPLRDVRDQRSYDEEQRGLVHLLELPSPDPAVIRQRWLTARTAAVPVGYADAQRFQIDLDRDGPHVLVAGTTGSGKSELLRTLVTALAATLSPERLCFVLIDYKGGSAFADCVRLPQVGALVTDLDPGLTSRALTALQAELGRRERLFAAAGVSDLAGLQQTDSAESIGRLVLVIDEFAVLAEQWPALMSGLLDLARRGRSLGMHLVLATQRPAGVVSPEIKANVGLRIALRVTDPADSMDVLDSPDAARINATTPGRAIARTTDGRLIPFQAANTGVVMRPPEMVTVDVLDEWHRPRQARSAVSTTTEREGLIDAISAAGEHQRVSAPWLAPLPTLLTLPPGTPGDQRVSFGLADDPARQRQFPVALDLAAGESLGFAGRPRSGRSTALRTIIGRAAAQLSSAALNLYVIDCAHDGLRPAADLPHCGAFLGSDQPALIGRLLERLFAEVGDRRQRAAAVARAARAGADPDRPTMLVLLDGWERFAALSEELDAGRSTELFAKLAADGPAVGVSVVVAGGRGLLSSRLPVLSRRYLLPLPDQADYSMAGLPPRPATANFPGRAICAEDGLEVQIGLLDPDPDDARQWHAVAERSASLPASEPARIRVLPLPERVRLAQLTGGDSEGDGDEREAGWVLGVGGDEAATVRHDFESDSGRRLLIAGPPGSGRSQAALLILRQAIAAGVHPVVAADAGSPVLRWAGTHSVRVLDPRLPDLPEETQLLVVDDAEALVGTVLGDRLLDWVVRRPAAAVVTTGMADLLSSFRGIGPAMLRYRCALLLQPASSDGDLLGVRLPRVGQAQVPGRGVLITPTIRRAGASYLPVQVAR